MEAFLSENAIGTHISKKPTLSATVQGLPDYRKPYQIFLGNPQSSRLTVSEADALKASEIVKTHDAQVFVHTPYIINLCQKNDWATTLLQKNASVSAAAGFKGVGAHVGKSVKLPLKDALDTMRYTLQEAIPHATAESPILLETPAGQGTETLTNPKDFIDFVKSFDDPRLRICLDTCHVFACGHQPLAYMDMVPPELLKLVHYNDSKEPCGSKKDRHAFMGTGHIGEEAMKRIAERCKSCGYPMVIE